MIHSWLILRSPGQILWLAKKQFSGLNQQKITLKAFPGKAGAGKEWKLKQERFLVLYEAGTASLNGAMITIQVCSGKPKRYLVFINSTKKLPPYWFKPLSRASKTYKVKSVSKAYSGSGWYSEV